VIRFPSADTARATAAVRAPIGVFPRSPALPVSWAGGPRPIRARVRHLGARFRWSGTYTATDSGAVSAGSNPAGGIGQRHKFEHSGNLERLQCQRCDLRKRGRVPDLAPYTCPTAKGRTGELPAQQHHTLTVSGPKQAVAPAPTLQLNGGAFTPSTRPHEACLADGATCPTSWVLAQRG
jgi:hypothetical protein